MLRQTVNWKRLETALQMDKGAEMQRCRWVCTVDIQIDRNTDRQIDKYADCQTDGLVSKT